MKKSIRTKSPLAIPILLKDKSFQEEFEEFYLTEHKDVPFGEEAKHGGELSQVSPLNGIGAYNPDNISIDTYSRMIANPQINAGLKVIKLPIVGQNWTIECQDKDIRDFIHHLLKPIWNNLINSTLTGIDYGFSAHEKVYEYKDLTLQREEKNTPYFKGNAVVLKKIKSLFPEWIQIITDKKDNFAGIVQKFRGDEILLPPNKSFVYTNDKGSSFGNIFGISRLKPCYETWYWWVSLTQFMLRYFERKGTPPVIVSFPPGKDRSGKEHSQTALEIGKALLSESVVALTSTRFPESKEKKWDINYLLDDKRGEMFLNALTWLDVKMLRGLFVPERTITQDTTTKAGSYSLSRVHADMFLLGEEALIVDIESQYNRYIVKDLVEFNFGANAPRATVRIERITDSKKSFLKGVFMEMVKDGTAIPAVKHISEVLGIPIDDRIHIHKPEDKDKKKEKREFIELVTHDKGYKWIENKVSYSNRKYPGHMSMDMMRNVLKRQGHKCANCKLDLKSHDVTIEHLKPVNDEKHLTITCHKCNSGQRIHGKKAVDEEGGWTFAEGQWWREPNQWEDVKNLEEIESVLDRRQEEFGVELTNEILNKQIEQVVKKVKNTLSKNLPLKNIWFKDVTIDGDIERVLWEPLKDKLIFKLKNYNQEFFEFGQKSAIKELDLRDKPKLDKETKNIIQGRAIAIGDRFLSNLRYEVELLLLTHNNKTEEDLISEIKGRIADKLRNVNIKQITEVESMEFLNKGRKRIVDLHT